MTNKLLPLAALVLALLVCRCGSVAGMSTVRGAPADAQTPTVQTQGSGQQTESDSETQDNGLNAQGEEQEAPEGVEGSEPAAEQAQEANLPGGGHQDQGQADHQFDGIE